ncbi:MAG TPA: hypothetical protein VGQ99_15035 [Tepidisphaeraceae bacterium]|nr:hypothetical protein [Tepidisphaeraceae bacterium]
MRVIRILPSALFPIITLMIARPAGAQSMAPSAPAPHLSLESDSLYGPISNDPQTPSVDKSWTTSRNGAGSEEVGSDTAGILDREIGPGLNNQGFYLDSESMSSSPATSGTRDWALNFPAGSDVRSDMKLDWYRLGYRFQLQKAQPDADLPFGVHSRVGVAVLDFQRRLESPSSGDADRSYITAAPQMGLEMEWRATNKLSIAGEVTSTVPLSSMPWILTTDVKASYTLLQKHGAGLNGYIGGGYEGFSFEERQDVRNEINADFGPMLKLGLELKF